MLFSIALSILSAIVTKLPVSDAYIDKRGLPCANKELLDSIPSEYVTWDGLIEIEMNCAEGHDSPLNMPDYNVFRCRPDGSDWNPAIFPDCNEEILPRTVFARFGATLTPGDCAGFTSWKPKGRTVTADWEQGRLDVSLCPSGSAFGSCNVIRATSVCDPLENKELESVEDLGLTDPHIFIKIQFPFKADISGTALAESQENVKSQLGQKLQELTGSTSEVTTRLKVPCGNGTIGVITERDRIACRGCPLGHYLDVMLKKCKLCAPGYYNDQPLQVACKLCPALRDVANKTIWKIVKSQSHDGSYAMVLCPTLTMDKNGNYAVKIAPKQPPKLYKRTIDPRYIKAQRNDVAPDHPLSLTALLCWFAVTWI